MDWNSAMKIARREAGIKELLMKARQEMFYMAFDDDSYILDSNFEYMMDVIEEWVGEYERNNEFEQADQLRAIIKDTKADMGFDQYDITNRFLEFLEIEFDFYSGLSKKYDRLLSVDKPKEQKFYQPRLAAYHPTHGWI